MAVMLNPGRGGRPIVLDKPIILIGRHPDCDVVLGGSAKISRKHCCLAVVDKRLVVRDLDSMNGVWLNGRRIDQCANVGMGDELMIGDLPFKLMSTASPEKKPTRPPEPSRSRPSDDDDSEVLDDDSLNTVGLEDSGKGRNDADPRTIDEPNFVDGPPESLEISSPFAMPVDDNSDDFFPLADLDDLPSRDD